MRRFLSALQFLTRFPVARKPSAGPPDLAASAGFFPIVGAIIGAVGGALYLALRRVLPQPISIVGLLAFSSAITGALHEDGLADCLDGLGGGWTREDALRIMRDSRIGAYGALGLALAVLAKYSALTALADSAVFKWYFLAQTAMRWTFLPLGRWLGSARDQGQGNLIAGRVGAGSVIIGTLVFAACALVLPVKSGAIAVAATCLVAVLTGLYYRARLGGITGDCLGATAQLAEVGIYLVALLTSARP